MTYRALMAISRRPTSSFYKSVTNPRQEAGKVKSTMYVFGGGP